MRDLYNFIYTQDFLDFFDWMRIEHPDFFIDTVETLPQFMIRFLSIPHSRRRYYYNAFKSQYGTDSYNSLPSTTWRYIP